MGVTLGYVIVYVDDVRSSIDFYASAFGLVERFVTPEGDYGELDTGSTTLAFVHRGLAEANLAGAGGFTRLDPAGPPPAVTITLVTADVAAAVAAAVTAGARLYVEPAVKPWGQTVAYVVDPDGVLVEIATAMPG